VAALCGAAGRAWAGSYGFAASTDSVTPL
jgi:hypothetical protein